MSLVRQALGRDTLRRAGAHLILAAALIAAGAAALALARWDRAQQTQQRDQAHAQRDALQAESDELSASLTLLEDNIDRFRVLQRDGYFGAGDRIAWTEALMRVRERLQLPDVAFELAPQQMLEPPTGGDFDLVDSERVVVASGPLGHDLRIQMRGLHEAELLALLDGLEAERVGHFRPQNCELKREAQIDGLQLDCTLRFVTYLPPVIDPNAEDAGDDADAEAAP